MLDTGDPCYVASQEGYEEQDMMRYFTLAVLPLALAASAQAQTAAPDMGKPATIPFIRHDAIQDFEADGDKGVYLQDRQHRWYYASVVGPCMSLPFATRIGVDTRFAGDTLDSTGTLLVDGDRCRIDRLVTSGPPPQRQKHKH
jgi:hypothetical protein